MKTPIPLNVKFLHYGKIILVFSIPNFRKKWSVHKKNWTAPRVAKIALSNITFALSVHCKQKLYFYEALAIFHVNKKFKKNHSQNWHCGNLPKILNVNRKNNCLFGIKKLNQLGLKFIFYLRSCTNINYVLLISSFIFSLFYFYFYFYKDSPYITFFNS